MRIKDLQWRNTLTNESVDGGFIRLCSDIKVGDKYGLFTITNIDYDQSIIEDKLSDNIHLFYTLMPSRNDEEFVFSDLDSAKKKANEIFESLVVKEYYIID